MSQLLMHSAAIAIACLAFGGSGRRLQEATEPSNNYRSPEIRKSLQANTLESLANLLLSFKPGTAFGLAHAGAVNVHRLDLASIVSDLSGRSRMAPVMQDGPECKYVVVVEGKSGIDAVMTAMGKEAFCVPINHKKFQMDYYWGDVEAALELFPKAEFVILTNADGKGRCFRDRCSREMGRRDSVKYALIPQRFCQCEDDYGYHYRGNVGIKHASPERIRHAIENAKSLNMNRNKYNITHLMQWGMTAPFGLDIETHDAVTKAILPYGNIRERRRLFGEYLGVGETAPPNLLRQLNRLFSDEEIEEALASLPGPGDTIPLKKTDDYEVMRAKRVKLNRQYQKRHDDYMKDLWMEKQARLRAARDAERREAAEVTSR